MIRELERDGRISNSQLASRLGIADSTCHKRFRALVDSGVITGFHAEVDPAAIGLQIEALISIRIHPHARGTLRKFQAYLERLPESKHVYFVAGERDFLMHVAVRDAGALRTLVSDQISTREEVAATNTSLIFDHSPQRRLQQ
ncbi:Lrp/AsnC family transcriptional regulator [Gulosibacter molinativorax]|uniref:Lrp/AsnC family transcriptional regulator n=2 Tax=Gulosibacter molinativorax TaxID=256821 RepID=A0ABT7C4A5_9MICO|nr:Lrp/AsnC family transcriptional regulator [Gulosibacter molinativorax]